MRLEKLNEYQKEQLSEFGVNLWYVLEIMGRYEDNPESVSNEWRKYFQNLGIFPVSDSSISGKSKKEKEPVEKPSGKSAYAPVDGEEAVPIRGSSAKIVENMNTSISIPTATSLRTIPVKILEENRKIINKNLQNFKKGKISYTHIIGWAIVRALKYVPVMNNSFAVIDGEPNLIKKSNVSLGIAVDVEKKDGTRSLVVPNIKNAEQLSFIEFFEYYNLLINKAKNNKLDLSDFLGTTITVTNPGTIGTVSSNPRLMLGQGTIVAAGAIEYPAEFQASTDEIISRLGISKIMNITSTYDHRIIQGAESGMFLKKINEMLIGNEGFYEEIFQGLGIPVKPVDWKKDNYPDETESHTNIKLLEKQAHTLQMINMFRVRGHLLANLDPLQHQMHYHPELDPSNYGFTIWDYDREFITEGLGGYRTAKLRNILEMLYQTYCGNIGVEYKHIQNPEEKDWLQNNMESIRNSPEFNKHIKKRILYKLIQSESFEKFIDKKYIGHKRFSIEGSEILIPVLDFLLNEAANDKVREVFLGMAHRGRLNVLANIIGKPLYAIFSEFEDIVNPDTVQGSGDVKYHLGASGIYKTFDEYEIKVSLASNPSHLEFVNPVVEGIVRAKQQRLNDEERNMVIPVLIHGDAAFAGEGIVAETLNLSQLKGYTTGGTIHFIINNQIGFTTTPVEARSSVYATDVAKMIQCPIFHVNGDDPEASLWVTKLAYEYRMKYNKDVVVDIFCYRRLGHNETDEPAFTQPVMYKLIKDHPPVKEIYKSKLIGDKVVTEDEYAATEREILGLMEKDFDFAHKKEKIEFVFDKPLAVSDEELKLMKNNSATHINPETLQTIMKSVSGLPQDFMIHPKLKKLFGYREEILKDVLNNKFDTDVDWSLGESLAFGSLLLEKVPVRLSGQDSTRGTFSQRHCVVADYNTGKEYIPLNHMNSEQVYIEPLDSMLSESAVLGFEYGYCTADPVTLVLWESQFGDFANVAQVMIDNFIVSSNSKWKQPNNIVMLLPHGQEGQGSEHSSARLERFLILCAEDNMLVCNPTTPAQYFHLLRKHAKSSALRPLVIMTPKSLLRNPLSYSYANEFLNGKFMEVVDDDIKDKNKIKNIILTSGKVYYDLLKHKRENNIDDYAIVRIEQYYPYPVQSIESTIKPYKNAKVLKWVQEEPENMGALNFIKCRLTENFPKYVLKFVSRKENPSPAPGSYKVYIETQYRLINNAFKVE